LSGEKSPRAKLTATEVHQIKTLKRSGLNNRQIVDKFGVTQCQIGKIVRGESWAAAD
jgi:predicted XRE-type DNA-binding protein